MPRCHLLLLGAALGAGSVAPAWGQTGGIVQADPITVKGQAVSSASGQAWSVPVDLGGEPAVGWSLLASRVPNLAIETGGGSSFGALYGLRGLSNTPYFTEPAVTLMFDDIPLGGALSYPTDVLGFASASVFIGPQPTAFGRSSDGGMIVLVPDSVGDGGDVAGGYASYHERFGLLQAGQTQGADGSLFVAAGFAERDGYIQNTLLKQRVDDLNAVEAFARDRFQPTASSEVTVEALVDGHRDGAAPLVPLGGPLFTVSRAKEGSTDTSFVGAAVKAAIDTGFGRMVEVTSFTRWTLNPYADWLVVPPAVQTTLIQDQTVWNEDLRLTSLPSSPVSWSIGAWLSSSDTDASAERLLNGLVPIQEPQFAYARHEEALFGEAGFSLAARWRLSVGGRIQEVDKAYHQIERATTPNGYYAFSRSDGAFLPRAVLSYEPDSLTTLAATVSFGTRPGGFATYTDKAALISFDAEHVAETELSAKRSLLRGALQATVRVFDDEITNYQIEQAFSTTDYFVATAPQARSAGAEGALAWKPAGSVAIGLSAGFTDITLRRFRDPLSGRDLSGNRAPYAPLFTASVTASYEPPSGWFGSAHLTATGRTFYTETENLLDSQAAYLTAGANAGYRFGRWRLSAFVENAFNEGYYSLILTGVGSGSPGAPRTLGGQVGYRW